MSSPAELQQLFEENKPLVYLTFACALLGYLAVGFVNAGKGRGKGSLAAAMLSVPYFRSAKKLTFKDEMILSLLESTLEKGPCFVLTDPDLPDNPIVYASPAFCAHTLYAKDEVENRNCRFLQGSGTKKEDIARIRKAVDAKEPCSVRLLNYRKDGSSFVNQFFLTPLFCEQGSNVVAYYLGVQAEVTSDEKKDKKELENPGYRVFSYFKQG